MLDLNGIYEVQVLSLNGEVIARHAVQGVALVNEQLKAFFERYEDPEIKVYKLTNKQALEMLHASSELSFLTIV